MNVFDPKVIRELSINFPLLSIAMVLLGAFLVTYHVIPKILWVIKEKNLLKPVIERSAHQEETPSFGGVAFFVTLIMVISMLQSIHNDTGSHIIAALTILFMVGVKDDLVVSTARVKLVGQLIASSFVIFSPELTITSLHGFLGIHEIPGIIGILISFGIIILMINAYNLIDGINGLAGTIGSIICCCYGLVFYLMGNDFFMMIAVTVVGILLAFLRFNLSTGKNKIFMGDSGSLIIGFVIGFLTIKILAIPEQIPYLENGFSPINRVPFILAVLFVPLFDTFRVMTLRILNGGSPFVAGRDHTHHLLLDCGLNHPRSSLVLGLVNILVIATFLVLASVLSNGLLLCSMLLLFILFFFLFQAVSKFYVERKTADFKEKKSREMASVE